ncbi:MAG: hypothetical protein GKR87_06470 [Kiritimatiellae bacterium]|nr:hypothetical protein [Kiritimatiellia bacterium]
MSIKEIAMHTIQELPDTVSWGKVEEKIRFVAGIQKAMRSLDKGKGLPVEDVEAMIEEWSTK